MQTMQQASGTDSCARCGATSSTSGGKLFKCSRCRSVAYCGKDCQKQDWKQHKKTCGKAAVPTKAAEHGGEEDGEDTLTCYICLEGGGGEGGVISEDGVLPMGCGCRGSSGKVHGACAVKGAEAQVRRAGSWAGPGKYPWQLCPLCKVPYSGPLRLLLAKEWARRTRGRPRRDTEAFAASTALGNALCALSRLAEAEEIVRGNLVTSTAVHGSEHRMTLGTTMNLALLLKQQGKAQEATAIYQKLHATQLRMLGEEHPDTLTTAMELAGQLLEAGQPGQAAAQYSCIHKLQVKSLGKSHSASLTCHMNLGSALLDQGKYKEALAVYEENLRDKRRLLGPEHPATLMVHMNVATVRREMGQVEKAEEMFQLNWETKKRALGAKHLDTCFAAINLQATWVMAGTGGRQGEQGEGRAVGLARATLALLREQFEQTHPAVLAAQCEVAWAKAASGHRAAGVQGMKAVVEKMLLLHKHNLDHPEILAARLRLGRLLAGDEVGGRKGGTGGGGRDGGGERKGGEEKEELEGEVGVALVRDAAGRRAAVSGANHPRTHSANVHLAAVLLRAMLRANSSGAAGGDSREAREAEARALLEVSEAGLASAVAATHPDLLKARDLMTGFSRAFPNERRG